MKKQLTTFLITTTFLTLGVFVLANQAHAETEISGNVTSNTTWTLADSPYIVTGTVQILNDVKLIIEPGVAIKFNKNTGLNVDGELIAVGTPNAIILFTSNQLSPHGGDWLGIQFTDNADGALFNSSGDYLSGSTIKYSTIEYGGTGTRGGIRVDPTGFSLFLDSNIIRNNNEIGITLSGSNGKIINNTISNHSAYGIVLSLYSKNNIVSNNIISNNPQHGIYVGSHNNTISNNTITGGSRGLFLERANDNTISNNIFSSNSGGITLISSKNNTLSGNNMAGAGIYIGGSVTEASPNTITNNIIKNAVTGINFVHPQKIKYLITIME